MNLRLKRTLPYLRLLMVAPPRNRTNMLKSYPAFVIHDMVEILYNILCNNVTLRNSNYIKTMNSKQTSLNNIFQVARKPKLRKKVLLSQNGGFLGAMVPIVASVLGGLAGTAL